MSIRYEEPTRSTIEVAIAALYIAVGLLTMFAPGQWILTPAHEQFFGIISRPAWGLLCLLGAALLIVQMGTRLFRHVLAAFVSMMWAGVAFWPIFDGLVWNSISVAAWMTFAFLVIVDGFEDA